MTTPHALGLAGMMVTMELFLGENLIQWLLLAFGGALFAGNIAALIKPPADPDEDALERAPVARSVTYAVIGLVAAIWAIATLVAN